MIKLILLKKTMHLHKFSKMGGSSMLLRQIEYFQVIIENGNFYEAAE